MKKGIVLLLFIGSLLSCAQEAKDTGGQNYEILEDSVSSTYYKKDGNTSFLAFMKNPEETSRSLILSRSADTEENSELTEEMMFAELWSELGDDDKQVIMSGLDDAEVSFDSVLAIDKNSDIGRAVLSGDDSELNTLSVYYGLIAEINDIAGSKTVPVTILDEKFDSEEITELPAAPVIERSIREENWKQLKTVLTSIDCSDCYDRLKSKWNMLTSSWQEEKQTTARSSSSSGFGYTTALYENLGENLKNGDVLLTNYANKAYGIAGDWSHGGIFSKSKYIERGRSDAAKCVYTAQPEKSGGSSGSSFPQYADMEPDRYGMACLEPVFAYTRMKKVAVLRPKNYTAQKASQAVLTAETVYYNAKAKYSLPIYEMFFEKPTAASWILNPCGSALSKAFDTSHDLTAKNTYCTKVVYTSWKKSGVDLDSNVFAGNLVSPDDLYGSSVNRYKTLGIRILWYTYRKTWKTYSATSNVIVKKVR